MKLSGGEAGSSVRLQKVQDKKILQMINKIYRHIYSMDLTGSYKHYM